MAEDPENPENGESTPPIICSRCKNANDDILFVCAACNAPLWDVDGDAPMPEQGERFLNLAWACTQMLRGGFNLQEFRRWVDDFAYELAQKELAIRQVEIPFGLEEDFAEEQEVGLVGVDLCSQAIIHLYYYDGQNHGRAYLESGLNKFFDGVCKVKEAMKINRRNRGRPLWA